jgi:glutathione S-transferase
VRKVVFTAQLLELPFERIDAGAAFGVVKTPEYLARNPNALVPLLEDGDFDSGESNVIVRYLCARIRRGPALPAGPARALRRRALDGLAADHAQPRRPRGLHPVDPHAGGATQPGVIDASVPPPSRCWRCSMRISRGAPSWPATR